MANGKGPHAGVVVTGNEGPDGSKAFYILVEALPVREKETLSGSNANPSNGKPFCVAACCTSSTPHDINSGEQKPSFVHAAICPKNPDDGHPQPATLYAVRHSPTTYSIFEGSPTTPGAMCMSPAAGATSSATSNG